MNDTKQTTLETGNQFATALVKNRFADAHAMNLKPPSETRNLLANLGLLLFLPVVWLA